MDWQNIFYFVGTIFMIFMMVLLMAVGFFLYRLRQNIEIVSRLAKRPAETASEIGAGIVEGVAIKLKEWTNKKASG